MQLWCTLIDQVCAGSQAAIANYLQIYYIQSNFFISWFFFSKELKKETPELARKGMVYSVICEFLWNFDLYPLLVIVML